MRKEERQITKLFNKASRKLVILYLYEIIHNKHMWSISYSHIPCAENVPYKSLSLTRNPSTRHKKFPFKLVRVIQVTLKIIWTIDCYCCLGCLSEAECRTLLLKMLHT